MREAAAGTERITAPAVPEDRRSSPRRSSPVVVAFHDLSRPGDLPVLARVRDLSEYGVGLLTSGPVPTRALLSLAFPGNTQVLARAVHVTPDGRDWLVGCAFVRELDEAGLVPFGVGRVAALEGDARRWERFACDVKARCLPLGGRDHEAVDARIMDASAGGVGMVVRLEFAPGSLVTLDLEGSAGGAGRRELARVVRAVRAAAGWFLGCEFAVRLTEADLERLRRAAPPGLT